MNTTIEKQAIPVEYSRPVTHEEIARWKRERPAGRRVFHPTGGHETRTERRMSLSSLRRTNNRANHKQRDKVRIRMSRFAMIIDACRKGLKYEAAIRRMNEPKAKPKLSACD